MKSLAMLLRRGDVNACVSANRKFVIWKNVLMQNSYEEVINDCVIVGRGINHSCPRQL